MTKINGPINVARLEGTVNGLHKIIYIFMDYHLPVSSQLQCEDMAVDVQYYIADSLKNNNKQIDFFVEIFPSKINSPQNVNRGRYIDEIIRYFKKNISAGPSNEKLDKNNKQSNPNNTLNKQTNLIRYHYIDIRDALESTIVKHLYSLLRLTHDGLCSHVIYSPDQLVGHIESLHALFLVTYRVTFDKVIKNNTVKQNTKIFGDQLVLVFKYIGKIVLKYDNDDIKEKILNYLEVFIKPHFDNIFKIFDELLVLIKNLKKQDLDPTTLKVTKNMRHESHIYGYITSEIEDILFQFDKLINQLDNETLWLFSRYVDMFFLRRFLDKKYITNAITYTGIAHSMVYIRTLVQDFDFKVTNTSYNYFNDVEKLTKEIKNVKTQFEMEKFFYPKTLSQCSNLTNFPEKFS